MELCQIVEQCQQGNREAFGLLYTTCSKRLRATCLHMVENKQVVDDLLHDAFVLIFTHIGELRDPSKAEIWMNTIVRNVALLNAQEQKVHQQVPLNEINEPLTAPPADVTYDEIMNFVDALPNGYQRVFRLSALEGLNHEQIAELLHIAPHSSSSQLSRAKQQLRRWLRPLLLLLIVAALPLTYWLLQKDQFPKEITQLKRETEPQKHKTTTNKDKGAISPIEPIGLLRPVKPRRPIAPTAHVEEEPKLESTPQVTPQQKHEEVPQPKHEETPAPKSDVNKPDVKFVHQQTISTTSGWTLAMSYSGMNRSQDLTLPEASLDANTAVYDSLCHHDMPLTVSLTLSRQLNKHWQLGIGLRYQRLTSDMKSGNSAASLVQHQRVQYLGIPVTLSWHQPLGRWFNTYLSATVAIDLPLRSTLESAYDIGGNMIDPTSERQHPGMLWSIGLGAGLQYNPVPQLGFFVEPTLLHYFNNSSNVETWNTAHPVVFSLPIGLRITF